MDNVVVIVNHNEVEFALKTMKKLMLKDGIFKEMKKRTYYENPQRSASGSRPRRVRSSARP